MALRAADSDEAASGAAPLSREATPWSPLGRARGPDRRRGRPPHFGGVFNGAVVEGLGESDDAGGVANHPM